MIAAEAGVGNSSFLKRVRAKRAHRDNNRTQTMEDKGRNVMMCNTVEKKYSIHDGKSSIEPVVTYLRDRSR